MTFATLKREALLLARMPTLMSFGWRFITLVVSTSSSTGIGEKDCKVLGKCHLLKAKNWWSLQGPNIWLPAPPLSR